MFQIVMVSYNSRFFNSELALIMNVKLNDNIRRFNTVLILEVIQVTVDVQFSTLTFLRKSSLLRRNIQTSLVNYFLVLIKRMDEKSQTILLMDK